MNISEAMAVKIANRDVAKLEINGETVWENKVILYDGNKVKAADWGGNATDNDGCLYASASVNSSATNISRAVDRVEKLKEGKKIYYNCVSRAFNHTSSSTNSLVMFICKKSYYNGANPYSHRACSETWDVLSAGEGSFTIPALTNSDDSDEYKLVIRIICSVINYGSCSFKFKDIYMK